MCSGSFAFPVLLWIQAKKIQLWFKIDICNCTRCQIWKRLPLHRYSHKSFLFIMTCFPWDTIYFNSRLMYIQLYRIRTIKLIKTSSKNMEMYTWSKIRKVFQPYSIQKSYWKEFTSQQENIQQKITDLHRKFINIGKCQQKDNNYRLMRLLIHAHRLKLGII